jgi:hypothetical protein
VWSQIVHHREEGFNDWIQEWQTPDARATGRKQNILFMKIRITSPQLIPN